MKTILIVSLCAIAAVLAYHEHNKGRTLWPSIAILSLALILVVIL